MMHGPLLAALFVISNSLLVSGAHIGISSEIGTKGCPLPGVFHGGDYKIKVDEDDYDYTNSNELDSDSTGFYIDFECRNGYTLIGQPQVRCTRNKWETNLPKCQRIPSGCQKPENILWGSSVLDDDYEIDADGRSWAPEGSQLMFSCNTGYKLTGDLRVSCLGNNLWDEPFPKCQKLDCDVPPPVEGGYWRIARSRSNSYVVLHCSEGYILENPKVRVVKCEGVNNMELNFQRENWPACRKLAVCPDPGFPSPGTGIRIGPKGPFYEGTVVIYECEEEFKLVGRESIRCQDDSTWDSSRPSCNRKELAVCPDPGFPSPGTGRRIGPKGPFYEGTVVGYECEEEFELVGRNAIRCQDDSTWDTSRPSCNRKVVPDGCKLPRNFPRGSFSLDKHRIMGDNGDSWAPPGSMVEFECQSGYKIIGSPSVLCDEEENQWESLLPKCRKGYCEKLKKMEGGNWNSTERSLNNRVSLSCEERYVLKDPLANTLKCEEVNGTELEWTGIKPACRKLAICPDPGTPAPGTGSRAVSDKDFYEGSWVSYKCDDGYELVGQESIHCQADSTWDSPRARCKPNITCADIPILPHQKLFLSKQEPSTDFFVPGHTVKLSCVKGYMPDPELGSTSVTCTETGAWDSDLTICKEIVCSSPELPKNGYLLNRSKDDKYRDDIEVKYRCEPGYRLFGYNWNRCTDSGWKNKPPVCEVVTCSDPMAPMQGRRYGSSAPHGVNSTVFFSCSDGYELIGSSKRKCMSNGQWDGTLAICTLRKEGQCPNPGVPINGFREDSKSSFEPGYTVKFGCNSDFIREGPATRTCQENGLWDGQEVLCKGKYDVARPEEVKFRMLDKLDTDLTLQDTEYKAVNWTDQNSYGLMDKISNTGGHLFYYFVLDSSDSVGEDNFRTSIQFASALIKRVGVSNNIHVGLVTYGSEAKLVLSPFHNTRKIVEGKLLNISYIGGGTATKPALTMVNGLVTQSSRVYKNSRIQSVIFLVTDGLHNNGGNPDQEAKILKDLGVEIFVIGLVGHKDINRISMQKLATAEGKHVFYTDGYETMEYLVDELLSDSIDYSHCGISVRKEVDAKIVFGENSVIHWPWMVHLSITKLNWKNQIFNDTCGGSIIENSWVLTAAHCLDGVHIDNVTLTAGVLNLDLENDANKQTRSVESTWIHPKFTRNNLDYDIALLKLKTQLKYGKYIRRICLPPEFSEIGWNSTLYKTNEVSHVIGFGITEEGRVSRDLKEADVFLQSTATCRRSIQGHVAEMTDRMICAGHPEGGKDICDGDSGGPLMQEVDSGSKVREPYWVQIGVVSWGITKKCGEPGYYGFYTHLAKLKKDVVKEIETH